MDQIERKIKEAEEEFNRQATLREEEELRKLHQPVVDDAGIAVEKIEIVKVAPVPEAPTAAEASSAAEVPAGEKKDIKEILQGIQHDKE